MDDIPTKGATEETSSAEGAGSSVAPDSEIANRRVADLLRLLDAWAKEATSNDKEKTDETNEE